jgi:hypothetical protein
MSSAPEAITAELLKRLGALTIEGDTIVSGTPAQRPSWPRYAEGPTDSVRMFIASFKLVAKASGTPEKRWGLIYVSLLHGYAATLAVLFLEDKPAATYEELLQHVCDTLERQHVSADKTALKVRILGPTEDLGDFAIALRVLTRRAYGHVYKPPQVEERAGKAFVRGLTGPLRQRVRKDFAENLNAALQLARNLEAVGISRLDRVVAPVAPSEPGPRAAVGAGAWNGGNRGQAGNRNGGSQGPQGFRPSSGSSQGSGARPAVVCWHCGLKGHTKAECRKKAAADAAARHGAPSKNGEVAGGYRPPESK